MFDFKKILSKSFTSGLILIKNNNNILCSHIFLNNENYFLSSYATQNSTANFFFLQTLESNSLRFIYEYIIALQREYILNQIFLHKSFTYRKNITRGLEHTRNHIQMFCHVLLNDMSNSCEACVRIP